MKSYYQNSEGQMIFDKTVGLFPFFFGLFIKVFVYFPLLLTGYIIARWLLPPGAKGCYWVGVIIAIAVVLYSALFIVKGVLIALRARRHWAWILLALVCISYTSIPPAMLVHHFVKGHLNFAWVEWTLSISIGYLSYSRYHFLVDRVPERMWGLYATGLRLGKHPVLRTRQ